MLYLSVSRIRSRIHDLNTPSQYWWRSSKLRKMQIFLSEVSLKLRAWLRVSQFFIRRCRHLCRISTPVMLTPCPPRFKDGSKDNRWHSIQNMINEDFIFEMTTYISVTFTLSSDLFYRKITIKVNINASTFAFRPRKAINMIHQ